MNSFKTLPCFCTSKRMPLKLFTESCLNYFSSLACNQNHDLKVSSGHWKIALKVCPFWLLAKHVQLLTLTWKLTILDATTNMREKKYLQ